MCFACGETCIDGRGRAGGVGSIGPGRTEDDWRLRGTFHHSDGYFQSEVRIPSVQGVRRLCVRCGFFLFALRRRRFAVNFGRNKRYPPRRLLRKKAILVKKIVPPPQVLIGFGRSDFSRATAVHNQITMVFATEDRRRARLCSHPPRKESQRG